MELVARLPDRFTTTRFLSIYPELVPLLRYECNLAIGRRKNEMILADASNLLPALKPRGTDGKVCSLALAWINLPQYNYPRLEPSS